MYTDCLSVHILCIHMSLYCCKHTNMRLFITCGKMQLMTSNLNSVVYNRIIKRLVAKVNLLFALFFFQPIWVSVYAPLWTCTYLGLMHRGVEFYAGSCIKSNLQCSSAPTIVCPYRVEMLTKYKSIIQNYSMPRSLCTTAAAAYTLSMFPYPSGPVIIQGEAAAQNDLSFRALSHGLSEPVCPFFRWT